MINSYVGLGQSMSRYKASSYHELVDAPFFAGQFDVDDIILLQQRLKALHWERERRYQAMRKCYDDLMAQRTPWTKVKDFFRFRFDWQLWDICEHKN